MPERPERERIRLVLFYGTVILVGYLVFLVIQPFLGPLLWAAVLAVCFYPLQVRIEARFAPARAALVTTLLVTVILILPSIVLLSVLIREGAVALSEIQRVFSESEPARVQRFWETLQRRLPVPSPVGLMSIFTDAVKNLATMIAAQTGGVVRNIALFLLNLLITLFALFFFLRDARGIGRTARKLLPFEDRQRERLIAQALDLIYASVTASLAVAAAQGLLGGAIFALLGISAPVFWGVVMAFCSLIPAVGSSLVWLPAAIWLLISGETARGVILLGLGAGVVGMVDNFLRPLLLSGRTAMNGLVLLISLLGGVAAFGFIGLVLGPVVLATGATLLDAYRTTETESKG